VTDYRVKFADTLTDVVRDEFPLTAPAFDVRISGAGELQGTVPIVRGDYSLGRRLQAIKSCGGSAVYVYRDGALWWDGLLWTIDRAKDGQGTPSMSISAGTAESYLDHTKLLTDLPPVLAADQLAIAGSFIDHLQADPYANLRITYDAGQTSGVIRDRVAYQAAARPTYGQMLGDLANLDNGFEYLIRTLTDPTTGARTRRMRLGYPVISSATVHTLTEPGGAILSYSFSQDGSRGATYLTAQGNSASSSAHTDLAALAAGYPRTDLTTNYPNITDTTVLEAHAAADLARARVPVLIPQVKIRLDGAPDITPDALGDYIRLNIVDEHFPDGIALTYRLVGMKVTPEQRGIPESADLVLN
jgi:hypothetical protein